MDKETAISATRRGAVAACISGGMTILIYLIASLTQAGDGPALAFYNDPTVIIDIILIFVLAWFIYKKSRVAAILMFAYFIFAKIYMAVAEEQFSGLFVGAIFLFFFGRAIWGAFAFHKIEKSENPNYRPSKKWIWFIISPVIGLLVLFMGLGLMEAGGFIPSIEVQKGADVPERQVEILISKGIISETDKVEYFYSEGFISVLAGGNILTDKEIISYAKNKNGELEVYTINYEDVAKIDVLETGDFITDAVYRVSTEDDETWLEVWLSVENNGHLKFIEALEAKIEKPNP